MDITTYYRKASEIKHLFEEDEDKIEAWEKAGYYSVREITEMLRRLKEKRDWLLGKLDGEFMKALEGRWGR